MSSMKDLFEDLRAEWSATPEQRNRATEMAFRVAERTARAAARQAKPRRDPVLDGLPPALRIEVERLSAQAKVASAAKADAAEWRQRTATARIAERAARKWADEQERAQRREKRQMERALRRAVIPGARQRARALAEAVAAGGNLVDQVDLMARRDFRSRKVVDQHEAREALDEIRSRRPWRTEGVSRATWYRRKADGP